MESKEKTTVSFGFAKKTEKKALKQIENTDSKNETDFITSVEGQEVKSVIPKEEKKELVIPLIKTNNWKTNYAGRTTADKAAPADSLDSQALREIVQDAAKQNEEWEKTGLVDENLEIPLLMQNKVPDGFETDEKLDVSLRPDEPEDTDYDEIPIESFGFAMLRGMGWKEGQGIGRNNKHVAPVEATLRPKGLGLGADRKQADGLNSSKKGGNYKQNEEDGELVMKKGAYCLVVKGPHKDLYGVIEGLDEDNARVMIKLTVSGKVTTVSQYNIKLVSSKEYKKYSKYINKGAADRYKEKEKAGREDRDSDRDQSDRNAGEDRLSDLDLDDSGRDRGDKRHHRKHEKHRDSYNDRSSRKRKHEDERSGSHHHSSSSHQSSNGTSHSTHKSLWVRSKLRVRIVDEKYKKGKYFNTKVVVVDVFDKHHCVCKTDEGKVLEDISQSMLETVVPKSEDSYVCIVSGKYSGQIAKVLEKNKKKYEAMLQLLSDRDKVLQMDYDSICEYVGDINEEYDY